MFKSLFRKQKKTLNDKMKKQKEIKVKFKHRSASNAKFL
jgi:hypothetical protein